MNASIQRGPQAFDRWRTARAIRKAGFWFVDIPRTSSSSIKSELGRRYGPAFGKSNMIEQTFATPQWVPDHVAAVAMREKMGKDLWDRLYTFTFVRNPFDRVHSLYHYVRKTRSIPEDWSFPDFVKSLIDPRPRRRYLRARLLRMTMADFLLDGDGTNLVRDVFRFEDRSAGITRAAEQIGFPELGRRHIQSATPPGQHYRDAYDTATRDRVAQYFAQDLALFDYRF